MTLVIPRRKIILRPRGDYPLNPLNPNIKYLMGLWMMNSQCNIFRDLSGRHNHLTPINFESNEYNPGTFGQGPALEIQNDDHLKLSAAKDAVVMGADEWTLICRIRFDSSLAGSTANTGGVVGYPIITKGVGEADGDNRDGNYFLGWDTSDRLVGDYEDIASGANHSVTGSTVLSQNIWYDIACTYDGSNIKVWFRQAGVDLLFREDGSTASTNNPRSDSIQKFCIGSTINSVDSTQGNFSGQISWAAVFNKSLEYRGLIDFDIYDYFKAEYSYINIAAVGGVTVPIMSHHYTKNIGAGR